MQTGPDPSTLRACLVGTGAIGCYLGGLLTRAGADLHLLAHSQTDHLRENGIVIHRLNNREEPTVRIQPVKVASSAAAIGPCDLVLIALKTTANGALPGLLPALIGPQTIVITLQNGLGNVATISRLVPSNRIMAGLCLIGAVRTGPGQVECYSVGPGAISLAEAEGLPTERTRMVADWLSRSGLAISVLDNLETALWRKLIWNVPFNGLAVAAGGITTDRILASQPLRAIAVQLMKELQRAAETRGVQIPDSFIERQIPFTEPMGPYRPSSLADFMAGREVEVEAIFGEPLRQGQAAGVEMPHLATLYALLDQIAGHRRFHG